MTFSCRVLMLVAACCFASCGPLRDDLQLDLYNAEVLATVSSQPTGEWRVHYVFDQPYGSLFFSRSLGNYRHSTWKPLTPGVSMERIGGFDAVLMDSPKTELDFSFSPYTGGIPKDYTPFIPFSDGGLALYTGQFELLPETDRAAIAALAGDIDRWQGEQPILAVRVQSNKQIIYNGEVKTREAVRTGQGDGTYIYLGDASPVQAADMTGVIDPGLPQWLKDRIEPELGSIFDANRALWGEGLDQKATVLFAFRGFNGPGFSNTGGAVRSLLALESSGENLRSFHDDVLIYFRWFFAHEVVHLFQNRDGVSTANRSDAWMTEGAANAMAISVLGRIGAGDNGFAMEKYARAINDCSVYLADGPLLEAAQRGQFDAFYTCGDLIAQMTNSALANDDLYSFWNALLARGAATDNHQYSTEDYFDVLCQLGASESVVEQLRMLVYQRLTDPRATLLHAMQASGLAPQFDGDGELVDISLPGNGAQSREPMQR